MKIALIHGQNHKGSSCHIGRMLAAQFPGSQVSEFFLPKDLEHFCIGCYACIEEEADCPYYAEKKRITDAIEAADLLIFTTPTYCMRASAPMKALIDLTFTYWMSHKPRACMFGKKAVVIATAAGSGAKSAVKDIANTLFYWGVPEVKNYGISVQAMGWGQVSEKKKARIEKDMKRLADGIAKKKDVRVGLKTRLVFGMMRKMQIRGWGASPKEKAYWENCGWLGAGRPWKAAEKPGKEKHGAQR